MKPYDQQYYVEAPKTTDGVEFFKMNLARGEIGAMAHIHNAVEFLYVNHGSFLMYADEKSFIATEGDLVIFRSNTIHRVYALDEFESNSYYVIKINPRILLDLCGEGSGARYTMEFIVTRPDSVCHIKKEEIIDSPVPHTVMTMISELENPTEYTNLVYKTGAIQLLVYVLKRRQSNEASYEQDGFNTAMIYKTVTYISSHFHENIDAAFCAREANMSYSHFSRCFKRITGQGFKEYLNGVRIDRARKLLLTTDKTVTEIALECGYNNVSYFIMLYRNQRGITPSEDRRIT